MFPSGGHLYADAGALMQGAAVTEGLGASTQRAGAADADAAGRGASTQRTVAGGVGPVCWDGGIDPARMGRGR